MEKKIPTRTPNIWFETYTTATVNGGMTFPPSCTAWVSVAGNPKRMKRTITMATRPEVETKLRKDKRIDGWVEVDKFSNPI